MASVPALEKGNALRLKLRTAVAVAVIAPTLAVPAAAGATTVIGSGSSAEQPILTALFAGYHKLHHSINFVYTADGGNAGVKDVQSGTSQFAVNTRAPLPSDAGTLQAKLYLDGLCVAVNKANKANMSLSSTCWPAGRLGSAATVRGAASPTHRARASARTAPSRWITEPACAVACSTLG